MTRTKYGVSPWLDAVSKKRRPDFPRFHGTDSYPVVIVGGGLAGCCTAYAFAAAGIKVALLEAHQLGHVGASHSPGILQAEATSSYRDIESRYGRRAARAVFDSSRRAVLDLASTARRLGIKAGLETGDAQRLVASYRSEEKPLMKETEARREAGLDAVWLKASAAVRESGVESARGGVRFHDWGHADPFRLLIGFTKAASERGAAIFEGSPVRRVKVRRKHVDVIAQGGTIAAETLIVCTGEPTDLYRSLKRHVRLEEQYAVLTDRPPSSVRKQIGLKGRVLTDTEAPPHLVRWTNDAQIVIAGASQPRPPSRARDKIVIQKTGQLMYELSRLYPAISGVMPAYGWAIPTSSTADGVMYAGPHRNFPRHLFAWSTRHDPAQAFLASRILLRHYLGQSDREDRYFAFTRG